MNKQERLDAIINEAVKCKHEIARLQTNIADLRHYAATDCKCDPKQFNAWVRDTLTLYGAEVLETQPVVV